MNTRKVALSVIQGVIQDRHSLTAALDQYLPALDSPQDRGFVQALCYGLIRHYVALEVILQSLMAKPLKAKESDIKHLAMLGLYQLAFMRVKPHAAVSETVAAANKRQPWAKSLLNGVLRNYLRQLDANGGPALVPIKAEQSHPDWLIDHIRADWPEYADAIFAANQQLPPMTLRVNALRCSRAAYLQQLADADIAAAAGAYSEQCVHLLQALPVEQLPHFADGWVSVQDAAAQLAASLLDTQVGQRVLDLCAAPGGKACAILETQPALKELWAVDIDEKRLARVGVNLSRLGLTAKLQVGDALDTNSWWDGQLFDRILVDAPCSALGVIRRHPDIMVLRKASDIEALVQLQQQILQQAWQMLAPGGMLLYATCSILKVENEAQVAAFLAQQADALEVPIHADWGVQATVGRQVITGSGGEQRAAKRGEMEAALMESPAASGSMDGFYYARLQKLDLLASSNG